MDSRRILRQQFLVVVNKQLEDNEPPETRQTLERLQAEGYTEEEAKDLISVCVASEIFNVVNENRPYDSEQYRACLASLPDLPE